MVRGGPFSKQLGDRLCRSLKVGLWSHPTNATLLPHGRLKYEATGAKSPIGWEKGLRAENQSPDRTPCLCRGNSPTGDRNSGLPTL